MKVTRVMDLVIAFVVGIMISFIFLGDDKSLPMQYAKTANQAEAKIVIVVGFDKRMTGSYEMKRVGVVGKDGSEQISVEDWLKNKNLQEEVVLIAKTPENTVVIRNKLTETLTEILTNLGRK